LGKDSIRCYICSKSHSSEQHDQHCPHKHAVAGLYDCKQYKCLNCHKTGHHCRDIRCPARDLYHPWVTRKTGRTQEKGKNKEVMAKDKQVTSPNPRAGTGTEDYDKLFNSTLQPTLFSMPGQSSSLMLNGAFTMETDKEPPTTAGWDANPLPPQPINYSPSLLQGDAANEPIA
jgi:hypothetical protein